MDDAADAFQGLPLMIRPDGDAPNVNERVVIYEGRFELQLATEVLSVDGRIFYAWRPRPCVRFRGTIDRYTLDFTIARLAIPGRKLEHGSGHITHIGGSDGSVTGIFNNPFIIHEGPNADRLTFQLPNFREVLGMPVRTADRLHANRIELEDAEWIIRLDRQPDAGEKVKALKDDGGYGLTVCGEAIFKNTSFIYADSTRLINKLGLFLTFLNGRRCFPCLIRGRKADALAWAEYSSYYADEYKEEYSWLPQQYELTLSELWRNFGRTIADPEANECLDLLIHWYVEANNNSGFAEGAIVFMQNAFELLYNWKIGKPQKGQKINADDKLRALLMRAKIPVQIPPAYQQIDTDLRAKNIIVKDLPELFTRVRNAIVHSDNNKRKTLRAIPSMDRFHIRHLGLYCLELLILHELHYNGKFANRISLNKFVGGNEEIVPWV
ncbi:hypothetical protein ACFS5N_13470 [Mucilaginibacter ximonensis]|uniref:YopA central domain-containing protein n=1 Tax=Mucilaginibacter ximonensis TaxID=538021 RepID=A0ABW5YE57_9SPHI